MAEILGEWVIFQVLAKHQKHKHKLLPKIDALERKNRLKRHTLRKLHATMIEVLSSTTESHYENINQLLFSFLHTVLMMVGFICFLPVEYKVLYSNIKV